MHKLMSLWACACAAFASRRSSCSSAVSSNWDNSACSCESMDIIASLSELNRRRGTGGKFDQELEGLSEGDTIECACACDPAAAGKG